MPTINRQRLLPGVLVLMSLLAGCGGGTSTAEFCDAWQASIDQLAVVAALDEQDPAYAVELQLSADLNVAAYDLAPADVREAAQQLADVTAQRTPEELLELSAQTDELTDTIFTYVEENC